MEGSYEIVKEITSVREVQNIMRENGVDNNNWLFLGTGGWHGTNKTLDDCERILKGEDETWLPGGAYVTVLLINPKAVSIRWGEVHVRTLNEANWLREKVRETLDIIPITQEGNK
jgi:hypothetical protein